VSTDPQIQPLRRWTARVLAHRQLSPTGFELTLSRDGVAFRAGQLLTIHGRDLLEERSYSMASGEADDELRVLYRLIPGGRLTPWLAGLRPGEPLEVSAPYGEFTVRDPSRPLVFIATGTGLAPCRSFRRTYPQLHLTVLHGVRTAEDLFYRDEWTAGTTYYPCLSGGQAPGCFTGRVTARARALSFPPEAHFYLCGANEMFYEMRDLLQARGIDLANAFSEAYYYRSDE
jgi:ferredoxin-NADP reductase